MAPSPLTTPAAATSGAALPRGAIACLALTAFGSSLSLRMNDALLPQLAHQFGISLGSASQVISLFAIAYGFAQLLFGPVGDRFGKYRVVGWSGCGLRAVGAQVRRGARLRVAARCADACGHRGAGVPLSMAWIGDVVPYKEPSRC